MKDVVANTIILFWVIFPHMYVRYVKEDFGDYKPTILAEAQESMRSVKAKVLTTIKPALQKTARTKER